ncbi:hypothetical protein D0Z07_3196 [Hyphodiscus hymeniophilus]|uniref:Uncharacterized protein n=1 Tax=Hyphodiscus hymeniophilus TaxID=353542 RepID=A0A9P7AYW3_9HELO|nr:hypothetical protein D0Z07_3196 [Hyphodiscus hymeniophilus]
MESSPLIIAHDHARAASIATQSSDTTVAINEHALAAGEFAKAASGTGSAEALRTLRLLEQHHHKLSELLRYPSENPVTSSPGETEVQSTTEKPISTSAAVAELRASKSDIGPRSSSPLRNPPGLQHPRRLPPRDLSSSIASNLASARGIRSNYIRQPSSPSLSSQQAHGNLETHRRKLSNVPQSIPEHSQPSWLPPTQSQSRKAEPQTGTSITSAVAEPAASTTNDDGFSRFYNTFENILSKLSAPLAFAGLPLTSEENPSPTPDVSSPNAKKIRGQKERSPSDPDLTKYFSRSALRATVAGTSGNDSFYVVPPSGHTVSYAHILSFAEKEKRRLAASMHSENPDLFADPDEDDFFDAKELPGPPSPTSSKRFMAGNKRLGGKQLEVKVEELDLENKSLKEVVDKLSKRLHAFEMAAQNSSMALQESMRLMRPMSPAPEAMSGDGVLRKRVAELEEHVALGGREIERLGRENEKLKSVVARYRERWEKLKEGAKTRRDGGKEGSMKDGQGKRDDPGLGR